MFLNTLFVRRLFCDDKIALCFKSELFFYEQNSYICVQDSTTLTHYHQSDQLF